MREPEGVPTVRWHCVSWGCRKSYADRSKARKHAAICPKDPDNRCCLTCEHFDDAEYDDLPGCDKGLEVGGGYGTGDPLTRDCPEWEPSKSQLKHNPLLAAPSPVTGGGPADG